MPSRRRPPPEPPRASPPPAPYPTLDLHGETAEAARRRATRWLALQRDAGERVAIVVTGRGLHSVGPPVLPGEIDDLLRSLHGTLVRRHAREPGGGAFRVTLLAPPSRARAAPTAPPMDAALRREAEEALAELGVTPTPALVAAEVERRLRERKSER